MEQESLYASFLLERQVGLEIAIPAERVLETTNLVEPLLPLPSGADCLEGLMRLRDDVIPVINLKKRLGISPATYGKGARVAVVQLKSVRYGLLFDDIRDVLRVPREAVCQIPQVLLERESVITEILKLNNGRRTLQLLDLNRMLETQDFVSSSPEIKKGDGADTHARDGGNRYVVFRCSGQEYGVPVDCTIEICFVSEVDETFRNGIVQGALQLRGHVIPVLNGNVMLGYSGPMGVSEKTRVLVMRKQGIYFAIIVDEILEITHIYTEDILLMPETDINGVSGVFQPADSRNIMLLDVDSLLATQIDSIRKMARYNPAAEKENIFSTTRHMITEHCYLIFSIGKNFAIELMDVQEIIEAEELISLPDSNGVLREVLNLRGTIVPVLNLPEFFGYQDRELTGAKSMKLVIGRYGTHKVGLMVNDIVTIYKQEKFYDTPTLKPELEAKRDTVDRLIEYTGDTGLKEQVLIVNVKNILKNHLNIAVENDSNEQSGEVEQPSDSIDNCVDTQDCETDMAM